MAETVSLKPCPFCGAAAWVHSHARALSDAAVGHRIECEGECHSMTCYWHTKEQAVAVWNRRPIDPAVAELVEALRTTLDDLYWMSAASDFGPDGQAHAGWVKVREKAKATSALLAKHAVKP